MPRPPVKSPPLPPRPPHPTVTGKHAAYLMSADDQAIAILKMTSQGCCTTTPASTWMVQILPSLMCDGSIPPLPKGGSGPPLERFKGMQTSTSDNNDDSSTARFGYPENTDGGDF